MGELKAEAIPYETFWEKVRIVAEYHFNKGCKVEIMDEYIYVEYKGEGLRN